MNSGNDPIPTWTGRPVDAGDQQVTSDASVSIDSADKPATPRPAETGPVPRLDARPTSAGRGPEFDNRGRGIASFLPLVGGIVAGVALFLLLGSVLGWGWLGGSGDDVDASGTTTDQSIAEGADSSAVDVAGDGDDAGSAVLGEASDTGAGGTDMTVETEEEPALQAGQPTELDPVMVATYNARAAADGEMAWALYRDGVIYLQGEVPSQAFADELKSRTADLRPGLVTLVDNYLVNPDAPAPRNPPLFLRESVAFVDGSDEIETDSERVVNAAPFALVAFFPDASLTIVSYAPLGDDGTADEALATRRAEVIVGRWEQLGLDRSKVQVEIASPAEAEAVGAQGVEFVVRDLLG